MRIAIVSLQLFPRDYPFDSHVTLSGKSNKFRRCDIRNLSHNLKRCVPNTLNTPRLRMHTIGCVLRSSRHFYARIVSRD